MSKGRRTLRASLVVTLTATFLVSSFLVLTSVNNVRAGTGLQLKWARNVGLATYVGPLAAHLVPGAKEMQIVVTGVSRADQGFNNGSVAVLNGSDGSIVWKVDPDNIQDHSPFEITDLNGDGNMEIIVANLENTLVLYGNNGSTYWKNTAAPSFFNYPVVADVNGDGYPEVFVSSGRAPYDGVDYITELSYDGQILAQTPDWHACWGGLSLADPASNGTFILYQGDRSSTYNPSGDAYKGGGWGVRALDARTLTPLWNDSEVLSSSHIPMLVDVDGDGVLDVVVGWQSNGLAVYNAFNGSVLTTGGIYRKNSTLGLAVHSQPTIYVDANGHPQLITNLDSNPTVWDLKSWQKTATLPYSTGEPPKMGRVTGDNQSDIILVESSNVHVFNESFQEVANFTGLTNPNEFTLVQDVDGDGYNELVLTSRNGWVYALDTPAKASTPLPRSEISFYSEYALGVAEFVEPPGSEAPQIRTPSPANLASDVSINLLDLSFNLFDYQGHPMNYTVITTPDVGEGNEINVSSGRYTVPISGLNYSTTYSWAVNVTDGNLHSVTTLTFTTQDRRQLTIEEQIKAIKDEVKTLVTDRSLNKKQGGTLESKLDGALRSLSDGQNDAAVDGLRAFIKQVNRFVSENVLTQNEAYRLVDPAEDAINRILLAGVILGDLNGDKIVNVYDAILFASKFNLTPINPAWDSATDLIKDEIINILDAVVLAENYGKSST